ncbi:MAG: hypothetical protein IKJ99_09760 [Oscillospiraceae bacterium]|nr:hypothetical protein [Oscillospiraceae bacterium]
MSDTFYRDQLRTKQAKSFYDAICSSISRGNLGGIYPLNYQNRSAAIRDSFNAIHALRNDRPDFFFIGSKSEAMLRGSRLVLMNEVLYTPDQIRQILVYLEKALDQFTAGTAGLSAWNREKLVYERISRYLVYVDHSAGKEPKDYDHNIVGPILQRSGVCESFSCLLMLALRKAGIPCIRVSGYGRNEAHCWNIAWIDGSPAHLDITWDLANEQGNVGFSYFNLTDEQISRDHKITTKGLPACLDHTVGYHFHEGVVFATPEAASRYLKKAFLRNRGSYSIRFSGVSDMRSGIQKALRSAPPLNYHYSYNDTQHTALIWGV